MSTVSLPSDDPNAFAFRRWREEMGGEGKLGGKRRGEQVRRGEKGGVTGLN